MTQLYKKATCARTTYPQLKISHQIRCHSLMTSDNVRNRWLCSTKQNSTGHIFLYCQFIQVLIS